MLFGNKNLEKSKVIRPSDSYCIWEVDISKVAPNCSVSVGTGCSVMYLINGMVEDTYYEGDSFEIKTKKSVKAGEEQLIAVNDKKVFTSNWGIGGVPYCDNEVNKLETEIGMHGEYSFHIVKGSKLFRDLAKTNVTAEDIKSYTDAKLSELTKTALCAVVKNKKYRDICANQSAISEQIKNKFEEVLGTLGLEIKSFSLEEIFFPDDYKEERNKRLSNNSELDPFGFGVAVGEDDVMQEAKDFFKMCQNGSGSPVKEVTAQQETQKIVVTKCPRCNKENEANAVYCVKCGTKLVK